MVVWKLSMKEWESATVTAAYLLNCKNIENKIVSRMTKWPKLVFTGCFGQLVFGYPWWNVEFCEFNIKKLKFQIDMICTLGWAQVLIFDFKFDDTRLSS